MELRKNVAQLIIPRLDGDRIVKDKEYFGYTTSLVDAGIGGFILFGGNIPETPEAIRRFQERASIPLLITSDIERGLRQQLEGGTRFPNQWAVAEAIDRDSPDDLVLLREMLSVVRDECLAAGIHVVFSPVADVNVNPYNPIICTRSFGEDPERVLWFVKEYVKGLQKTGGVMACAKHFPGHGDTSVDSHTSLPVINVERERLEKVELPPFKAAINAGVGMIMVGHLRVPALEPEPVPATFSKKIITGLLREEMGFSGLIITDALDMGALKSICDEGEAGIRCLGAGCDILLHPSEPLKMLNAIVKAVEEGRLPFERVEEAYSRVMSVKNQATKSPHPPFAKGGQGGIYTALAVRIAQKAVKFRKGRGLDPAEKVVCMVIDDDGDGSVAVPFLEAMKGSFPNFRVVSSPVEVTEVETAVLPIFSKVSAWKGSSGLSRESSERVNASLERARQSVIISFGSPYILNNFNADVMMDAFDPADFMQRTVVERLMSFF